MKCIGLGLMRPVVVEDQMHVQDLVDHGVDLIQKLDEFLRPMAQQAFADHLARFDVERSKQRRRAVALVVVGHRGRPALLQGQARLCAVEGLDLALLVHAQHQRLVRRVHVKADDVGDVLGDSDRSRP